MRHFSAMCGVLATAIGLTACGDNPGGSDLFGGGSRSSALAGTDGGGGRPSVGGSLAGGSHMGGASPASAGGARSEDLPTAGGQGGTVDEAAGADAGGANGGSRSNAGSGGASAGRANTSGSSSGGAGSDAGGAASAGGGTTAAGTGGTASAGEGGSAAGAGVGGKLDARVCVELRVKAETLLEEAQRCRPSAATSCSGFVKDECGCSVVVDDPKSNEAEQYVSVIAQLRAGCTANCLPLMCRAPSTAQCMSAGRDEARCVPRGGPITQL